jgi:hypothetical protein
MQVIQFNNNNNNNNKTIITQVTTFTYSVYVINNKITTTKRSKIKNLKILNDEQKKKELKRGTEKRRIEEKGKAN